MQVITAIDEHLHTVKPEPFRIMEEIINRECGHLFPFFQCYFSHNICHSLYIGGAFQKKEEWANRIYQNSPHFDYHVFCLSQWHNESHNQSFSFSGSTGWKVKGNMRAKNKEKCPVKMAKYIVSQLKKLAEQNTTAEINPPC